MTFTILHWVNFWKNQKSKKKSHEILEEFMDKTKLNLKSINSFN